MNRCVSAFARPVCLLLLAVLPGLAAEGAQDVGRESQRLRTRVGAGTAISVHPATGVARFVRVAPGSGADLSPLAGGSAEAKADAFFREHGALFGIRDARTELRLVGNRVDGLGMTRLTYEQVNHGLPVFAGVLRLHFDRSGRLTTVNGAFVPDVAVPAEPRIKSAAAAQVAMRHGDSPDGDAPRSSAAARVLASGIVIFREGLVQGLAGKTHLAYQVDVAKGDLSRRVFVDAVSGKYIDSYDLTENALFRRSFDGANSPTEPGPNYPANPFWNEGDPFPTGTAEADNMILSSLETYNHFENAFAFDSGNLYPFFPATAGEMHSIFNRGWACPNASWNSTYISFCPGFTTDDVTGHEWSHAFTEFTSGLIYQWQSGALNESYSDVWGETVDLINGRGLDTPGGPRLAGQCSTVGGTPPPRFTVNSPPSIAGDKINKGAAWTPSNINITSGVELVNDGAGASTSDGCEAFTVTAGAIALLDRGNCTFALKADNAAAAGAVAVVVANNTAGVITMGGAPASLLPAVMILQSDGAAIKAALLGGPVNATLAIDPSTDPSLRWLIGEEVNPGGALRDMWNPACFGNPGTVSDQANYVCSTTDGGGVHTNSGVPNHAYALLTDGGTYNGHTVGAIGMTKTAHIWFRAQSQYLVPASDFSDMADAMEQSCADLTGVNLPSLSTGAPGGPSGQIIGPADCAAVSEAIAATEMRVPPTFCNFVPLLNHNTAPLCPAGQAPTPVFQESFETDPFLAGWTATTGTISPDFTPRAWTWANSLPARAGSGVFGIDFPGGTCAPGGDESGVIQLSSPAFVVPANARVSFDHWVASELNFDGGNLKVSVNGGAFNVVPGSAYTFNPYNVASMQATNPLAGQPGFSGSDGGSNSGSWGTSVVNLAGIANAGDSVQFRYDFGQDGCAGIVGWYLDNFNAYACQAVGGGNPSISIDDVSVVEGNTGTTNALFTVSLTPPDPSGPHSVDFTTQDGTAQVADADYFAVNGTVVFLANETSRTITVTVIGDTRFEADETYSVSLSNATGATIVDGIGAGTILNDDKPLATGTRNELVHDSRETRDLNNISQFWHISQKAHSSYEVEVDAVTGDIGAAGPDLFRIDSDGTSVLQTGTSPSGGSSKSLRFENTAASSNDGQFIRVHSAGCVADCDASDTFRIRAYDTTYRMSRFNNSATQITVLVIANPTDQAVTGNLWFYQASTGNLLASQAVSIAAKATLVLNTSTITALQGQAGTATFSNDAAFGALTGKAVAVEPATGFTFDTAMVPRTATTKMVPRDN